MVSHGRVGIGSAGQARHGESVYGGFRLGVAGSVRHGWAWNV